MFKQGHCGAWYLVVTVGLILGRPVPSEAQGFILWDHEELTVNTPSYMEGVLYDESRARILADVQLLQAYDSSAVDMSAGWVIWLYAHETSAVRISGGHVSALYAQDSPLVDICGGGVDYLDANDRTLADISGGWVTSLHARGMSVVTINAADFELREGLTLEGKRVLGTGVLVVESFDGRLWGCNILTNDSGATILAVPDPSTVALLGLGGVGLLRRRRK